MTVVFKDANLNEAIAGISGEPADWQELNLSGKNLTSLEGLEQCAQLISLDVSVNDVEAIKPICSLVHLEKLYAQRNPFMDFSALKKLQKLKELRLGGTWEDYDVGELTLESYGPAWGETVTTTVLPHLVPLQNLQTLAFYNHGLVSLNQLQKLPKLRKLELIRGSRTIKLSTLAENRTIEEMFLVHTACTNLKCLRTFHKLKKLVIAGMSKKRLAEISHQVKDLEADGVSVTVDCG